MKIPKYVQDLMSRSEFELCHPEACPGYTIRIKKASPYTRADTLKSEVERLVSWANRMAPVPPEWNSDTAFIVSTPKDTHHRYQYAVVTIYDPIMRQLEKYIND